jgi:DNA-binding MarR family transcriptional regulator
MRSTPAPTAPSLDQFLCFAVHATGFAFNRVYREALRPLGVTYPQYLVMVALWTEDGVTVGALGERLALDSSTLTPLLKRLEGLGLITRRRSSQDERRVIVSLTAKGAAMRAAAEQVVRSVTMATGLTADGIARLTKDLQTLRDNLEHAALD